jgi:replicative DNA helicase
VGRDRQPRGGIVTVQQPAFDLDAERALIGACLTDLDALFDASEAVTPDDFHNPVHGHLFAAMIEMAMSGQTAIDAVTVGAYLRTKGIGADTVSLDYMTDCKATCEHLSLATAYAEVVADHAEMARLFHAANEIRQMALSGKKPSTVTPAAEERLFKAVTSRARRTSDKPETVGEMFPDWLATMEDRRRRQVEGQNTVGVSTGLKDLDASIDGLVPGRMYIVGAPPGAGKSSLVLRFAESMACDAGLAVLGHSIEMTKTEVMDRFVSSRAGVPAEDIKEGRFTEADKARLVDINDWPLTIDTTKQITVMEIRNQARRMKAKHGDRFGMIWLDYFQLLEAAQTQATSRGNLSDTLAEMSRQLKIMAGEFNVAVVVLSQLVKAGTDFGDSVPKAWMLKGTGGLHNDADVVMLVHRPDLNPDDMDAASGMAFIKIEKNRHGKFPDSIPVAYLGRFTTFRDLAVGVLSPAPVEAF